MWPLSILRKAIDERRLRRNCLDEILACVHEEGIELNKCSLTMHRKDPFRRGVDNSARRELEKLKRNNQRYSIGAVLVDIRKRIGEIRSDFSGLGVFYETVLIDAPKEGFQIGYAFNRAYDMQKQEYDDELTRLRQTEPSLVDRSGEIIENLRLSYIHRYEDWQKGIIQPNPAGFDDESDGKCPCCMGGGLKIFMDGITYEKCDVCGGSGNYSGPIEPLREPSCSDIVFRQNEEYRRVAREIKIRQKTNPKLLIPTSYSSVYVRFKTEE